VSPSRHEVRGVRTICNRIGRATRVPAGLSTAKHSSITFLAGLRRGKARAAGNCSSNRLEAAVGEGRACVSALPLHQLGSYQGSWDRQRFASRRLGGGEIQAHQLKHQQGRRAGWRRGTAGAGGHIQHPQLGRLAAAAEGAQDPAATAPATAAHRIGRCPLNRISTCGRRGRRSDRSGSRRRSDGGSSGG